MGSKPVFLSASRGAAFLGVSRYKSPLEAWCEMMEERKSGFCKANGFLTPVKVDPFELPLNPAFASLRWGLAFEGAICELSGVAKDRERAYVHPNYDFLTCHIDGRNEKELYQENKTVFDMAHKAGWGAPGTELIPVEHQIQFQHAAMCTGDKTGELNALVFPKAPAEFEKAGFRLEEFQTIYAITHPEKEISSTLDWARSFQMIGNFHKYILIANEAAQKEMLERYRYIWEKHILGETPPPVKGYDDIKWLFDAPEGEIEADENVKQLWSEYVDIDKEIDSMLERKDEIKNICADFVGKELQAKNIRKGGEPRKLNCYAGQRKLFTISRPEPGLKVSRSSTDRVKDDYPELYEEMKNVTFADLLGKVDLTDKQAEAVAAIDADFEEIALQAANIGANVEKFLGKKKLSAILSKENIIYAIEQYKPELFARLRECAIIETTEPVSRLTIKKPEEE